jgi:4-carboxymuconolactone decarboxylase
MSKERYDKGIEALKKITGPSGEAVVEGLKDIAPDLADWVIEFSYGTILSRPNIDFRLRQFVTVAALTAMGTATPQLKVQINGALNVGCKPEEIIEVILQMAIFAGFPAVINAINATREVFEERRIKLSK